MIRKTLIVPRGDTLCFGLKIDGIDQNLSTAYFSVSETYGPPYILQKSLEDGITDNGNGEYIVRVDPSDTTNQAIGQYNYDLQIGVGDDIFTVMKGPFVIERDITV